MTVTVEEAARHFLQRAQRIHAERERRAAETRTRVEAALVSSLPSGAQAWLIGSLVWGDFGERSDVDVVVSGVGPAELTHVEDAVARAGGVAVDLLCFDELPDAFQTRVAREGVLIRAR